MILSKDPAEDGPVLGYRTHKGPDTFASCERTADQRGLYPISVSSSAPLE